MHGEWVAASIRARLLARHRLGRVASHELATHDRWEDGLAVLAASAYGGRILPGASLAEAQHALACEAVWNLRILSGWIPGSDSELLRALVAGVEIANIEGHVLGLTASGVAVPAPVPLGSLGGAWRRVQDTGSAQAVREALTASVWGDPGTDRIEELSPVLRLRWAARLADAVPDAASWAGGLAALVLARERFVTERPLGDWARSAPPQVGRDWTRARTFDELAPLLPPGAAWVLDDVTSPQELWRGEACWWREIEQDALRRLAAPRPGPTVVAGAAALLLVDVWRIGAALTVLAGGASEREAFDVAA